MNTGLTEGADFYYNEQGYLVMTEAFHLARGYCCGNGCRHCPFGYENVPEPRRSILVSARKTQGKPGDPHYIEPNP